MLECSCQLIEDIKQKIVWLWSYQGTCKDGEGSRNKECAHSQRMDWGLLISILTSTSTSFNPTNVEAVGSNTSQSSTSHVNLSLKSSIAVKVFITLVLVSSGLSLSYGIVMKASISIFRHHGMHEISPLDHFFLEISQYFSLWTCSSWRFPYKEHQYWINSPRTCPPFSQAHLSQYVCPSDRFGMRWDNKINCQQREVF